MLEYRHLGKTGLEVSRLCMGLLTMSPLQLGLSPERGADLLRYAFDRGVNFFDTAKLYDAYAFVRKAFANSNQSIVVASRSYAYTAEQAKQDLEDALIQTGRERIELFGLHEQDSGLTLKGHSEALEYFYSAKEMGKIGAVLVSTHRVELVRALQSFPEIDVVHPLINMAGIGIRGGDLSDMLEAVSGVHALGRGVYTMKALGGGHLSQSAAQALGFAKELPFADAVAVGMGSEDEIDFATDLFSDRTPSPGVEAKLARYNRKVEIEEWCTGCGKCVRACPTGAVSLVEQKARVDTAKCILCGYCAAACEDFYIKVLHTPAALNQ